MNFTKLKRILSLSDNPSWATRSPDQQQVMPLEAPMPIKQGGIPTPGGATPPPKPGKMDSAAIGKAADSMLRGSFIQRAQEFDLEVTNGIRNLRIGSPRSTPGNVDVEAVNIFRGREHGLVDFDTMRQASGLPSYYGNGGEDDGENDGNGGDNGCVDDDAVEDSVECFMATGASLEQATKLKQLYGKLRRVDAFVGLMAERHAFADEHSSKKRGSIGETSTKIILDHFKKVRAGDRFFYLRSTEMGGLLSEDEIEQIDEQEQLLLKIIVRNFPTMSFSSIRDPFRSLA